MKIPDEMVKKGYFYTEEEIAIHRQQAKEMAIKAREASRRAGVKMHPRVAAIRARHATPSPSSPPPPEQKSQGQRTL